MYVPMRLATVQDAHYQVKIDCGNVSVNQALDTFGRAGVICSHTAVFKSTLYRRYPHYEHKITLTNFRVVDGVLWATADKICGVDFVIPVDQIVITTCLRVAANIKDSSMPNLRFATPEGMTEEVLAKLLEIPAGVDPKMTSLEYHEPPFRLKVVNPRIENGALVAMVGAHYEGVDLGGDLDINKLYRVVATRVMGSENAG